MTSKTSPSAFWSQTPPGWTYTTSSILTTISLPWLFTQHLVEYCPQSSTLFLPHWDRSATLQDTGIRTLYIHQCGSQCPQFSAKFRHVLLYSHREVGSTCHQQMLFAFALNFKNILRTTMQGLKEYAGLLYLVSIFTQNYLLHVFRCLWFRRVVICKQRPVGNADVSPLGTGDEVLWPWMYP